ncbi:SpoIIE family protein phosphatase [Streptomyces sp. RPA4-5]|uniref:SpoIIE family protein phosphatase n=1 Tax=unclassified Streptomyces TaxID=2593676 RepID=UPI00143E77ED|nr:MULTISPECIES: SpoIIE family protein phosphatase [unclassified Streptomyces]QIY57303.1 SpoIIE family protein phosphatase [Streptomyces sp. RPA4-5]WJY40361.1 SpoIIE family protein phosphatase [Streptomyces sp. P9-2B-2]
MRTVVYREDEPNPGDFQASASIVQAGFFCWEIATGEVSCDPLTLALHGMPESGPSGISSFLASVHESDLADVRDALGLISESCGNYQIEYRVTSDDGRHRSLEARGRVLPGADGLPARMVGVVMDTTAVHERHEAERRRLYERASRDRWMQELTAALAAAVTVKDIMTAAQAGLRTFGADALAVIAPEEDRLTVVASCADDEQGEDSIGVLDATARTLVKESLDRRAPVLIGSEDALRTSYPHLAPLAPSARQAWAALPLTDSRGRVSSCLVSFPEPQEFLLEERALLVAAMGLLAQSLERAGMYESEHALATELQRGMLPRGPLTVPGVTIAARYQAATSGMWIGGDWYDAISLPDGGVALVIGDVQGHSVHAASLMGRLRTAVHAYANEGHPPAAVLERTNRLLTELNTDPDRALFATCCYLALTPSDGTLRVCRAGHPPPALITPRKPPRLLEVPGGLPLGIDREQRYPTTRLRIAPGSVLALTTDGLLEAVNKDIDQGFERFLQGLRGAPTADLETVVDNLLAGTQKAHGLGDDVAVLLARLNRPGRRN